MFRTKPTGVMSGHLQKGCFQKDSPVPPETQCECYLNTGPLTPKAPVFPAFPRHSMSVIYADQLTPLAPPQLIGSPMAVPWSVWVWESRNRPVDQPRRWSVALQE